MAKWIQCWVMSDFWRDTQGRGWKTRTAWPPPQNKWYSVRRKLTFFKPEGTKKNREFRIRPPNSWNLRMEGKEMDRNVFRRIRVTLGCNTWTKTWEWESLIILFHFLCAQHVSGIYISIIRSLRLFCWITTLVVLFLVRCVLVFRCGWLFRVWSLQHGYHSNPTTPKLQHKSNQEQYDQCGNSTAQSQAPDDGYINVRNMLRT